MYYVLHRPHGTDEPWRELPGYRKRDHAIGEVRFLNDKKDECGKRAYDVKLCVGKGRNRRDILVLRGERGVF